MIIYFTEDSVSQSCQGDLPTESQVPRLISKFPEPKREGLLSADDSTRSPRLDQCFISKNCMCTTNLRHNLSEIYKV